MFLPLKNYNFKEYKKIQYKKKNTHGLDTRKTDFAAVNRMTLNYKKITLF